MTAMNVRTNVCKTCGQEVYSVTAEDQRIRLNAEPDAGGTYVIFASKGTKTIYARDLTDEDPRPYSRWARRTLVSTDKYRGHWEVCKGTRGPYQITVGSTTAREVNLS